MGGIYVASMSVVGAGWGTVHLVGYLASRPRRDKKAGMGSSFGGVWDRELDHDLPAAGRDAWNGDNG
jgi:hypothetical protein